MISHQPYIREIPAYCQHPNGCGLASLLMLLNPRDNQEIQQFLNEMWDILKPIYDKKKNKTPELRWAIVLEYILLKCLGYGDKQNIYDFLHDRMNYAYDDARIINKFTQEQNRQSLLDLKQMNQAFLYLYYTEMDDLVSPPILTQNLFTMKTDAELKILAELFNYEFIPKDGEDMTGAVYFTRKQISSRLSQTVKIKWRKLEEWANQQNQIILYGQAHHWLAIRGVYRTYQLKRKTSSILNEKDLKLSKELPEESAENHSSNNVKSALHQIQEIFEQEQHESIEWKARHMIIAVNDPAFCKPAKIHYSQISESDRFYVFRQRSQPDTAILSKILEMTKQDMIKELKIWQGFNKAQRAKTSISDILRKENSPDEN